MGIVSSVFVIIVLFREFSVTSIRLIAAENGKVVAANMWGKAKTVSQMAAIIVVLLYGVVTDITTLSENAVFVSTIVQQAILWISAVLTVISGVIYIKDNFGFIKNAK